MREQPTELRIARAIGRPDNQRQGVDRLQMRPDDQFDARLPSHAGLSRGTMGPHDAGERAAVGDGDRLVAEGMSPLHQFLWMRAALEK